jgi:hypothetical protein
MSSLTHSATALASRTSKQRWGYLLWGIAALVIGVPEITAAADHGALPFTTISGMTGHLERHHSWVELIVVALIVLAVFSIVRVSPRSRSGAADGFSVGNSQADQSSQALRTAGGRLTFRAKAATETTDEFDDSGASMLFALAAFASLAAIAVGTWAATRWWDDPRHYHPAYVLYGSLGLLWIVIPTLLALVRGSDMPFPTLFRTLGNLEESIASWRPGIGPALALGVSYVIYAGLAILLLHLTLYPYPDITKIINPHG